LSIRDTGSGMNQSSLSRAHEPFFTTKTRGEGTGLGLSMVHGFARQSGGDLAITSECGVGTQVTMTLPLVSKQPVSEVAAFPDVVKLGGPSRALVVDDREDLLDMLGQTLQRQGFDVSKAQNASAALRHVDSYQMPDLLVADVVMPGSMDGLELAEHLKLSSPELAVVLISGYTTQPHGDYVFLQKPFSMSQLEQSIVEALDEVSAMSS